MSVRALVTDGIHVEQERDDAVLVAFTDRHGGVSRAPYDSLNLAARVGDDSAGVETNRARVAEAIGFDVGALALARQVHGVRVLEVVEGCAGVVGEADILVTSTPGVVLGILTADCAPVVLARDGAVAIVHAGWRGLVAGAIAAGVEVLGDVRKAWIGPSIQACCYEVGPEVIDSFVTAGLPVADDRHVDTRAAARRALERAGVGEIEAVGGCTSCDTRYFSYRRDGVTGRQGTFSALLA